jgi:hypothetical protein
MRCLGSCGESWGGGPLGSLGLAGVTGGRKEPREAIGIMGAMEVAVGCEGLRGASGGAMGCRGKLICVLSVYKAV